MVQILENNKKPSFSSQINTAINAAQPGIENYFRQKQQSNAYEKLGIDPSVASLPKEAQAQYFKQKFESEDRSKKAADELTKNTNLIRGIEKQRGLEEGSLNEFIDNPLMAEKVTKPQKESKPALTEKPVPAEFATKLGEILSKNPDATADELTLEMNKAGIPPVYSDKYTENRRRTEESKTKTTEDKRKALRAETLPIRTKLAEKSQFAQKGIQNKEELLNLIKKGDIDDPTYATLAQSLPLNLGKRLLSNDTIEYKAGLVDEFGDLRNIFQGQTRVKEIELLEEKIADLYLTDDQKEAVLKSRINALKADIIRADAAAELEDQDLGVLQFEKELEKIVKPRLEALFNQILDEQKAIFKNAENRKAIPLDYNDPDDKKIAEAIIKEAGGNRNKARDLAKKKGYTF